MRLTLREISVMLTLGMILAILWVWAPGFFQAQPLLSLAAREAPALIVACGMALVIITRQIDVSVGSQFSICCICGGWLMTLNWPPILAFPMVMLIGTAMGCVNGWLVAGLGLPSIVVTLATMVTFREGLRWLREGVWVELPEGAQWFGASQSTGQWLIISAALGVFLTMAGATRWLSGARFLYAIGSDEEAARLAGVRTAPMTFGVFALLGALAGAAAMMNLVQSPQVDPNSGLGMELKVIAAAVVGGVAISGGRGNLWGVFAGLLVLSCIGPAMAHLRIEAYWEKAVQGAVILLAVVADGWRSQHHQKRGRAP
jgi:rhamnose transport system permease protein